MPVISHPPGHPRSACDDPPGIPSRCPHGGNGGHGETVRRLVRRAVVGLKDAEDCGDALRRDGGGEGRASHPGVMGRRSCRGRMDRRRPWGSGARNSPSVGVPQTTRIAESWRKPVRWEDE
nr:unnamed protein product [Digitaria exilis]